jgi:hypothetical protein
MGLRSRLEEEGADLTVQRLGPLPGSERGGPRSEMFAAAGTAFATRYGLADAATGEGTVIGVIGGYQQGGDSADVSYSAAFGQNVQTLNDTAVSYG